MSQFGGRHCNIPRGPESAGVETDGELSLSSHSQVAPSDRLKVRADLVHNDDNGLFISFPFLPTQ